jgi:hypothetical protein
MRPRRRVTMPIKGSFPGGVSFALADTEGVAENEVARLAAE